MLQQMLDANKLSAKERADHLAHQAVIDNGENWAQFEMTGRL